ncbi:MAG TPA: hypothetical protein VHJ82_04210 [Actinomycetota bacterium]|nr:hypothetical protein [Actinomycetota bacterium]
MISSSYLRVYQPIEAFSAQEQREWRSGGATPRTDVAAARWLVDASLPPADSALTEGVFVRKVEGQVYACPWRTRLRMLMAMLAFRGSVPGEVADLFVPEEEAQRAAHELAALADESSARAHILHANWHVPLRWFAAFDDAERSLIEDKHGLRLRYETRLDQARARLARAHEILDEAGIEAAVNEAVEDLRQWLEGFPGESLLELDYGSVAGLFSHDELLEDRSAADVWTCLDALERAELATAGRVFGELTDRWSAARSLEILN